MKRKLSIKRIINFKDLQPLKREQKNQNILAVSQIAFILPSENVEI